MMQVFNDGRVEAVEPLPTVAKRWCQCGRYKTPDGGTSEVLRGGEMWWHSWTNCSGYPGHAPE